MHACYYVIFVSDIAIFVLKRDVKLQLTNYYVRSYGTIFPPNFLLDKYDIMH